LTGDTGGKTVPASRRGVRRWSRSLISEALVNEIGLQDNGPLSSDDLAERTPTEDKLDSLISLVQQIAAGVKSLNNRVDSLDQKVGSLEQKVDLLDQKVKSLDQKVDSLEQKLMRGFMKRALSGRVY
jgi:peptidoglycan hydrolase CwlO-like protein